MVLRRQLSNLRSYIAGRRADGDADGEGGGGAPAPDVAETVDGEALPDVVPALVRRHFDSRFYLARNGDVAESGMDPAAHFYLYGAREGRDPAAFFNTARYMHEFGSLLPEDENPFLHFLSLAAEPAEPTEPVAGKRGGHGRLRFHPDVLIQLHRSFDLPFYLTFNSLEADGIATSLDGLLHYLETGWVDGFDPAPGFSTGYYLRAYHDVRLAGVNPLLHYVTAGRNEGRRTLPPRYQRAARKDFGWIVPRDGGASPPPETPEIRDDVTIIVPVFNAVADVRDLFASLDRTTLPGQHIVVVDDASTDAAVGPTLCEFAARRPNVDVIRHDGNKGFAASVNDGIVAADGNHVVVLNSDVVLPVGWMGRLLAPIDGARSSVGSATPFSNTSSLTGFPNLTTEGPLWRGRSLDEVDRAFSRLPPRPIELPSACGFCMALNADALAATGPFDSATFKRGYFEETDWCQRALANGFRHLVASNLFVEHKPGSSSFSLEERIALSKQNRPLFDARHPDYRERVRMFRFQDPAASLRKAVEVRLAADVATTRVLYITHSWGGGSYDYVRRAEEAVLDAGGLTGKLQIGPASAQLILRYGDFEVSESADLALAMNAALAFDFDEVEIHGLHGAADLLGVVRELADRLEGRTYRVVFHDFLPLCPTIHLIDDGDRFCGIPDVGRCLTCLHRNPETRYPTISITHWRQIWERLFRGAKDLVLLDDSAIAYLDAAFPALATANRVVTPPTYDPPIRPVAPAGPGPTLNVAVMGYLGHHKGAGVVKAFVDHVTETAADVRVTLFGEWTDSVRQPAELTVSGPYRVDELSKLMEDAGIHVVLFPSICPETFSFTLSEVFALGLPVVGFDIGAQGRRLRDYPKGMAIERGPATSEALLSALRDAASRD